MERCAQRATAEKRGEAEMAENMEKVREKGMEEWSRA